MPEEALTSFSVCGAHRYFNCKSGINSYIDV